MLHKLQNNNHQCKRFQNVAYTYANTIPCHIHCVPIKVDHQLMAITLSKLNRFSKFFHRWKEYTTSLQQPTDVQCSKQDFSNE